MRDAFLVFICAVGSMTFGFVSGNNHAVDKVVQGCATKRVLRLTEEVSAKCEVIEAASATAHGEGK